MRRNLSLIEVRGSVQKKVKLKVDAYAIISGFERAGQRNGNNKNFQFWQQDSHPFELYGYEMLKQKLEYLPVRTPALTIRSGEAGLAGIIIQ